MGSHSLHNLTVAFSNLGMDDALNEGDIKFYIGTTCFYRIGGTDCGVQRRVLDRHRKKVDFWYAITANLFHFFSRKLMSNCFV